MGQRVVFGLLVGLLFVGCGERKTEEDARREALGQKNGQEEKIEKDVGPERVLSVFETDGLLGLKDSTGEVIIPAEYDFARKIEGHGMFWLGKGARLDSTDEKLTGGGNYFLVSKKGNIINDTAYQDIGEFNEGVCWVEVWGEPDPAVSSDYGVRRGLINTKAEIVTDIKYPDIQPFNENGLARISVFDRKLIDQAAKKNFTVDEIYMKNYGFINTKGEIVIEPKFDFLAPHFFDGRCVGARVVFEDGYPVNILYGYIDEEGKVVVDFMYGAANGFMDGKAEVYDIQGNMRIIDKDGNCLEGCPNT